VKALGSFDEPEARQFLLGRLAGTGVSFPEAEIERLVRESRGRPAELQRLAGEVFERMKG
jgi:hypothetical protein